MTNEQKQMLLDLSRNTISNSIIKLENELKKVRISMDKERKDEIFGNCDQSLEDIKSELNKVKKLI